MCSYDARILVAERESAGENALHRRLIEAGHSVCATPSGRDVILLCEFDPPDVLIVDAQLPDMDGFEVCERVRREAYDSDPTIIVMADALDDMTHTYLGQMVEYAGGDYFLAKPCDLKLLLALLNEITLERTGQSGRSVRICPTNVTWPTRRSPVSARCG